jgi:exonuclease III
MSVLSTNCRGLGGAATVRELRDLVKRFTPSILCVVETQMHRSSVESLTRSLGFNKSFAVSSSGRSGGLGLFWNNEIKIEVLPYSQYHLDVIVSE